MLYLMPRAVRLCRRQLCLQNKYCIQTRTSTVAIGTQSEKKNNSKEFSELLQKYKDKITFHSHLEHEKLRLGYYQYHVNCLKEVKKNLQKKYKEKSFAPLPISLRYYVDEERLLKEENISVNAPPDNEFQLPYASPASVDYNNELVKTTNEVLSDEFDRSNIHKWMTNYEYYNDDSTVSSEVDTDDESDKSWSIYYGTPDPVAFVSRVPCGGCGALLHCNDPAIPGYLPSEIFKNRSIDELKTIECQRCHFLKEYNVALDISVRPEEYEKLLQSIRNVKSMVLLMVDLLDFPCSIWPGIVDIIGTDRPIIVVGNKVDLLPGDSIGYLKRVKESLRTELNKSKLAEANIKHIALISAKTGYGVEDLISALFKLWLYKGDVFLVGCTNVGKSSLFNALLQSDYCKVHAVDIIKRATVSRWPGTTLNLLKFPINRPSQWKIRERTKRLTTDRKLMKIEKEVRNAQLQGKVPEEAPALIGHIGRSFTDLNDIDEGGKQKMMVFDEKNKIFANSRWLYDTPGVIHPGQVLSILSTEELLLTIPKKMIRPQTYYLNKGQTIFIGGLARIDFVDCTVSCRFTIFCSESLPITVTQTENAEEIYNKFLGTELFAVPRGGEERVKSWPGLKPCDNLLEFGGEGPKWCCGDIVLSSIAWVGVTAKVDTACSVRAWTPDGRGIHRRYPSVLPYSINLKGKRLRDTPAYMIGNAYSDKE